MARPSVPAEKVSDTAVDPAAELRGKLVRRLAIAGVIVAILLGVLTLVDRLASPPDEESMPVFTRPIPVGPQKEISQPVTPASNLPEPPAATPAPVTPPPGTDAVPATAAPEALPPPTPAAQPVAAPVSAAPAVAASAPQTTPAPTSAAATAPARKPAASSGPPPAAPPVAKPVSAASVASKPASAPPIPEETAPPPIQPSAPALVSGVSSTRVTSVPPRLFSGFVLQAGVFSSPQLAEELHAKLALSGIASSLETRVQVGPFKTREEAEYAQQKLRELGINSTLVPPKGRR